MSYYTFTDIKGNKATVKYNIKDIKNAVYQIFQANAPERTGDLKRNMRIELSEKGFSVVVDIEYMPYTEEAWGFNRRWGYTGINPNQGWFKESFEISLRFLSQVYGKEFKRVT